MLGDLRKQKPGRRKNKTKKEEEPLIGCVIKVTIVANRD